MSEASIVLLTWNGEKYLDTVLQMIRRQKQQPLEVIAIDSSSTDSTLEILQKFQVPVKRIAKEEFSHPRTRNLAVSMCSGKYVVFLTQDAVPADSCWLECLLRPFQESERVAGVFSRQIPHPGASDLEANDLRLDFPPERLVKKIPADGIKDRNTIWKLIKFSNSSGAYLRELLLKNPFNEQLEMGEDQEWAKRLLEQNFSLIYEPSSVVLHSHEHNLKERYQRCLSMGKSFSTFLGLELGRRSFLSAFGAFAGHVYLDAYYIVKADAPFHRKLKWTMLSPLHRAVIHYAYRKGWNSAIAPLTRYRPVL